MKRGCLLSLLIWGACAYGYWYFTHARLIPPLDWIGPLVAGLIMTLVIGALRNAVAAARDAMKFSSTTVPGERPQDGEIVTVSGHIRAGGSPMRAPLSGKPAVLYAYEISHTVQSKNSVEDRNDFAGYGAASASIDSSTGSMRLLGFPMLDAFDKQSVDNAAEAAAKYIEETKFTDLTGFHPGAMYREIKELMTDDDGRLKKDWRMTHEWEPGETPAGTAAETQQAVKTEGAEHAADAADDAEEPEKFDLSGENFREQIVAPGDQVSAIGRYSSEKGGLVADTAHPLRLLPGDARAAAGAMWGKVASNVIGAIIFGVALNGVVFGVLKLHKPGSPIAFSPEIVREKRDKLHDAARNGKLADIEQLVTHGMPADARDDDRSTPLMRVPDANVAAFLIAHGADVNATDDKGQTPLMRQAQLGNTEVVKVLVKSGAKLDAKSTEWKLTALQMALDAEKLDVAQILRGAGATDDTVTEANGKPLSEDSEQVRVCRAYLDAVQREDRDALVKLSKFGSMDSVDFTVWKAVRPVQTRLVSAFANDTDATVVLRGATPRGTYVTWTYQVLRKPEGWKIGSERWETRLDGPQP